MLTAKSIAGLFSAIALGTGLLAVTPPALAVDLDQAKQQGLVCELPTGYLSPSPGATGAVRDLVERINAKREAEYRRIANEHGINIEQVGRMTADKLAPKCR